jgi:hypothetical protein
MIFLATAGCGPQERPRYHFSGTITYQGKPIPKGTILIDPDIAAGADGPQGFAEIEQGEFDTRRGGQGHGGGKVVLRIHGGDGSPLAGEEAPHGKPLFTPIEVALELPHAESKRDLALPLP